MITLINEELTAIISLDYINLIGFFRNTYIDGTNVGLTNVAWIFIIYAGALLYNR